MNAHNTTAVDTVADTTEAAIDTREPAESERTSPRGLSSDDWVALATCAALSMIVLPFMQFPDSTPRTALVMCTVPLGAARLIGGGRRHDRAALAGLAFAVWAVICALFSDSRWMSLLGSFGRDTSALVIVAAFGLWAVGRNTSTAGRAVMPWVLLGSLGLSALFGVLQVIVREPGGGLFGLVVGRADGLAGGHIYFGATMAGAAGVSAVVLMRRTRLWWAASFVFATCANLSGSRFPVVVGFVVGIVVFAMRRELRAAAVWCGVYVAAVLTSSVVLSLIPGTESAAGRAGSESAGRFDAWRYAWHAFMERPITGWGPTGFRGAVQGRFTADFTAHHAANELSQIWWDAHNIVVGVAVSFGFVGIALVAWFAVCAIRTARGALAVFVAVVATTWLLEPAGIATFPLTMLCLGAAMPALARAESPIASRRVPRVLLLAGGLLAMVYLLTDVRLHSGMLQRDPATVASAAAWAPWDPVAANTAAAAYANFDGSEPALRRALTWMERARQRQPDFPFYSNKIAQLNILLGDTDAARDAIDDALELQPWNVTALQLKYVVAKFTNDQPLMDTTKEQLCTLGPQFWQEETPCV